MSFAGGIVEDLANLSVFTKVVVAVTYRFKSSTPETTLSRGRSHLHQAATVLRETGLFVPPDELARLCDEVME